MRYLVPVGATDYWQGFENYIAEYSEALLMWRVLAPREGMLTWVKDEDEYYSYNGTSWEPLSEAHTHPNLPTDDEKAALAGTAGVPSDTNRYVTDADPRLLGAVGSGPMTATLYVVIPEDGLSTFPTVHEIPTDANAGPDLVWKVMHRKRWTMVSSIEAEAIGAFLKLKASVSSGTAQLRWMISTAEETLGAQPSVDAVDILEAPFSFGTTEKLFEVAGLVPVGALPTGSFELVLVGKPASFGQTVTAKILSDSSLELSY